LELLGWVGVVTVDTCEFPFSPLLPAEDTMTNKMNSYVGTEEGIFEYAINLADRKVFPALDLR
jgi:hypothetical protein